MQPISPDDVPQPLVDELLAGRCVAFVGGGFTAPAVRSWLELLEELARRLDDAERARPILGWLGQARGSLDIEGIGQLLRDEYIRQAGGDERAFEEAVIRCLPRGEGEGVVRRRARLLREVPFDAILTTNYDPYLPGGDPEAQYREVLRSPLQWWERVDWSDPAFAPRCRVIKLHGDANGEPGLNPIVLGREDYRRRVYGDRSYADFLRALLATRTVLFLGVSFSDAYLNELRSEVLSLLGRASAGAPPVWYAVHQDKGPEWRDYFRRCEGIEILPFAVEGGDFSGFDRWLEAIHRRTSVEGRLRAILHDPTLRPDAAAAPRIVWVDPDVESNRYGIERLQQLDVEVEQLDRPEALVADRHRGALLIISRFGYRASGQPDAVRLLEVVSGWRERPPVIVFADPEHGRENRRRVLRSGAYELATDWRDLFRLVERLYGRQPGA